MNARNRTRTMAITLTGCLLTLTAGCGDMISVSIKEGIFNWVSGSLSSSQVTDQLIDLINNAFNL